SDRNGLKIVVDLKKDSDANLILQYLYKNTDLQVYYNYNTIAIIQKRPMQLGLLQLLDTYIDHRKEVVLRRSQYDLDRKAQRAHIVEGLIKAISVLDEIIERIRQAKDKADAKRSIIARFGFSEEQAEAIVILRLYRLTNTDVLALAQEYDALQEEIAALQAIIAQPNLLIKTLVKELKDIKKQFANPRRSVIEHEIEDIVINKEDMIQNERVMLTLSQDGYLKRVSLRSFQASDIQTKVKDGDVLLGTNEVNTLDKLMFFTNKGNYGYLNVYDIEEAKWKDVGSHLNAYLKVETGETIVNGVTTSNFASHAFLITISKKGMVKKSLLSDFEVSRNNKLFSAMNLSEDDVLVRTLIAYEGQELLLLSQKGYVTRYNISLIPLMGVKAKGVKAMNLSEDELVDASIVHEQDQVVFLHEQGGSKRIKASEIVKTGRPARGEMICKRNKTNPYKLKYVIARNLQETFFLQNGENLVVTMKDIPLMNKEATFSNTLNMEQFYVYQHLPHIKQVSGKEPSESEISDHFQNLNLDI
ncbi:MAG: DNA gyrase subunit A, partial [Erysipelotrichaceae bacterium]